MKNRKLMTVISILVVMTLAACSNRAEEVATMENEPVPETSTNDLLVDSLEYLLREDGTAAALEEPQPSEEEQQQDEQGKEENGEETAEQKEVTIYYGNGASNMLSAEKTAMEQVTAEKLIDALLKHNIVSLGTKVNFFEEKEADGIKMLELDLSRTFRDYLKTMTQEGEKIIISSIAATFLEAYGADEIVITVDGKALETENSSYEEPIRLSSEIFIAPLAE